MGEVMGPRFALSVQQPWAYAILHMGKDVENRTWRPRRDVAGTRIWIHASKKRQPLDPEDLLDIRFLPEDIVHPPVSRLAVGAIVGSVIVDHFVESFDSEWFNGPIGWVLRDPEPLDAPITCRGNLGLWTVPPDVLERLAA